MGVGMGARYPLLKFENVAEIAISAGGILYMILSFIFIGALVMAVSRPIYIHLMNTLLFRNMDGGAVIYICYGLMVFLTFISTYIPMRQGIRYLERLEL